MATKEQLLEMPFPENGLNLALSDLPTDQSVEPGRTTDVGQNVRWFESLSERGRGGQRSGLSRLIDARVNGVGAIQHLNTVVRTDGNALDWEFQGEEFKATGLYLGLDLTDPIIGADEPTGGGGGFQPSESFSENRTRMSLSVDDTTQPINGESTVTATVTDAGGNPVSGQTVRIITSRGGAGGDEATGVTDAGGLATFTVTSDRAETIRYLGAVEDSSGKPVTRSRNAVKVTYGAIVFIQANVAPFTLGAASPRTCTFTSNVTAGNLLVVFYNLFGNGTTVTISDSRGNTYTDLTPVSPTFRLHMYYAIANSTGPCTVSLATSFLDYASIGILEYSGVSAVPLDSTANNLLQSGTALTTGPVTVGTTGLILGMFVQGSDVIAFTPGAGFTTRIDQPNGFSAMSMHVAEKLPALASQAITGTYSSDPGAGWDALGVSFK